MQFVSRGNEFDSGGHGVHCLRGGQVCSGERLAHMQNLCDRLVHHRHDRMFGVPCRQCMRRGFRVAAVMGRAGSQQPSEGDTQSQRSWSTFDDTGSGAGVPMQTNPMASTRESDLSRRASAIYAATEPARDTRTVSTIEKPQKAEL